MFAPPSALLGKYRASGIEATAKSLFFQVKNEGRPCIDIAGVASSILATPTIFPHSNSHLTAPSQRS